MNTAEKNLIELINNIPKLKEWFDDFDSRTASINDWQKLLGYPLEPHSCQIVHQIRNCIINGLSYRYGVGHLNNKTFKELGDSEFKRAIQYIEKGSVIREQMTELYPKIKELLYGN